MCGIFGFTGKSGVTTENILYDGLRRLTYRGYDSCGVAVLDNFRLEVTKTVGAVEKLEFKNWTDNSVGIAHTRWATHGGVTKGNAHPHLSYLGRVAVVHNGVIDNADELRASLNMPDIWKSETDTEVIAHLIEKYRVDGRSNLNALKMALAQLNGTYAIAVLFSDEQALYAAKKGSPLIIGVGEDKTYYISSDANSLSKYTSKVIYMEEGEVVKLESLYSIKSNILSNELVGGRIEEIKECEVAQESDQYMLDEIFQQPAALRRCFSGRIRDNICIFDGLSDIPQNIKKIVLLGCGSSYNAALAGSMAISNLSGIDCRAFVASEFLARNEKVDRDTIYFVLSQSGETYDVIEAIKEIKLLGGRVYGIVNVVNSTIARLCGAGIYIHAGQEMAVAATKSFICQYAALFMLSIYLGRQNGSLSRDDAEEFCNILKSMPDDIDRFLKYETDLIKDYAEELFNNNVSKILILGRGINYPVALEAALKLKEVCYIPVDAQPLAEIKHGTIALIEQDTPVFILGRGAQEDKARNEVEARGAKVYLTGYMDEIYYNPYLFSPLLEIVPYQLLSVYLGKLLGRNIDRPKNLAKSVTV